MPAEARRAWLVLYLWEDGIRLADGSRLWTGGVQELAEAASLAKHYVLTLLGEIVELDGLAVRPQGSRGCYVISQANRDRAAEVLESAEKDFGNFSEKRL